MIRYAITYYPPAATMSPYQLCIVPSTFRFTGKYAR